MTVGRPDASARRSRPSESRRQRLEDSLVDLLSALQRAHSSRTLGLCHTWRLFKRLGYGRFRCGLTGEPLAHVHVDKICREHEPAG